MAESFKHVVLTGVPGVGKTTLVRKVIERLKNENISLNGFVTEEVRDGSFRCGFDIVTLNGKRAPLSRSGQKDVEGPKVGKYTVCVKDFEELVLPLFQENGSKILVLDEIGKMELFSLEFKKQVELTFQMSTTSILATIPMTNVAPLVRTIRGDSKVLLINVDKTNRNYLEGEIINQLRKIVLQ